MKLAALFSDHAVLQRGISVPIWGWTQPRTRVQATLGKYAASSISGDDGKFVIRLPPMPAGGPFELEVRALPYAEKCVARDIYVGEVWLASGQSNMAFALWETGTQDEKAASDDRLRMITIPRNALVCPQSDVTAKWMTTSPGSARNFSAVAYYFARKLRAELGVAVGIVNSSWGGTIVEAWTSREALVRNPDTRHITLGYESMINSTEFWRTFQGVDVLNSEERNKVRVNGKEYPADPGNEGQGMGWSSAGLDDSAWQTMNLPNLWQTAGHNYSGIFWFRKSVVLPPEWAGRDLILGIGAVDKQDIAYFNGEEVGRTGTGFEMQHWGTPREYKVPGRLVKAGKNVIAVRAYSFVYAGGLTGPVDKMQVALADDSGEAISIAGEWLYKNERNFGLVKPAVIAGPGWCNSPYILYDSMIAPLVPYAIKGAIWYQGESNSENAAEYHSMLISMIRSWRYAWGQGDFPFLIVQLASYMDACKYQETCAWDYAMIRDAQLRALKEPETGLAVAIDIGEARNIHPKNKLDVGLRLSQWALAKTYGRAIVSSGPLYSGMTIEDSSLRIRFDNVGGGLVARGGRLDTFMVAGNARVFYPAAAIIDGSTVVVQSPEVPNPVAARYAWAANPEGCNLYNVEGLPASPFRTDNW